MLTKLVEHTCGNHIFMRLQLDNKRIEEIDAYITESGWTYKTSGDNRTEEPKLRQWIIEAFHILY